jgi:type IV secretory pathway VirD2 relaxase
MAVIKSTENKIKNQPSLLKAIYYITRDDKISEVSFSDGMYFISATDTAEMYQQIRQAHNKNSGILAHHYVQSFSPDDKLTPEQAHQIGLELARKIAPEYLTLVATHIDKDHLHNHILINSVNTLTGYKWHDNNKTVRHLRNVSDEICRKNILSIIGESDKKGIDRATYNLALQGKSWKVELVKILDEAVLNCKSKIEFIDFLNKRNFLVRYKTAHITATKKRRKKRYSS